ncbi:MFS transporter [Pseudocolwellia agarivorans]|uniref:MFS transporter n=1 Tax=Pseudocolwellia agarivorans TaxID=1911682 RepID=UPI00098470D8|nr:MFS transporter [Pseudocolwellia agarivorans]
MLLQHWRKRLSFLFLIQLLTVATMEMSGPFWPLYFKQLNQTYLGSITEQWASILGGLAYILPLLAAMLSAPFFGGIGDKYGHKLMLLRALFALGFCQLLLVWIQDPILILFIRLIQGFTAGTIAATQSYSAKVSPIKHRGKIFSRIQGATAAGSLIGPLAGGYWLEHLPMTTLFERSTLIFGVLFVVLYYFLPTDNKEEIYKKNKSNHPKIDLSNSLWSPAILLASICLAQLAKRFPQSFYALYGESVLGQGSLMIGILYAATGFGILIAAPYSGLYFDRLKKRKHKQYFLQVVCLIALILMLLQSQIYSFYPALAIRFGWGVCLAAILPLLSAQLSALGGIRNIGKQVGISHSAIKLGGILGIGIGSLIFALLNWQWAFIAIALIYVILIWVLNKTQVVQQKTPK